MRASRRTSGPGWLLGLCLACAGCAQGTGDAIVVLTTWPESQQRAFEAEFARWPGAAALPGGAGAFCWVRLSPGESLAEAVERLPGVDLLLGGPGSAYRQLASAGRLSPVERSGLPLWCVVKRTRLGLAVDVGKLSARGLAVPDSWDALANPLYRGKLALDDPRHDAATLALARGRLASGNWAEGYAWLVRSAANARPVGWRSGQALASLERGQVAIAPVLENSPGRADTRGATILPLPGSPELLEGAAVVRSAPRAERAQAVLRFLDERGEAEAPPARIDGDPQTDALLADLLGATLVDAQDELRLAWAAIARTTDAAGRAERESWLVEPPPWPPASVEAIESVGEPGPLLETLAGELVTEPEARAWLLQSWRAEARSIDGALLAEMARAAGGRLADEPRFRAWLRAEWTAWARQRYFRVGPWAAALAEARQP